jgi:leader peptidase (prepilin peptidase)/N-methyltransferase
VLKKEAMGFGDVKFVGAIGAFIGWQGAVAAVFGGAIIGTLWFALAMLWQGLFRKTVPAAPDSGSAHPEPPTVDSKPAVPPTPIGFGVQVPFGPMLAAGALIYFLCAHRWIDMYFASIAELL